MDINSLDWTFSLQVFWLQILGFRECHYTGRKEGRKEGRKKGRNNERKKERKERKKKERKKERKIERKKKHTDIIIL